MPRSPEPQLITRAPRPPADDVPSSSSSEDSDDGVADEEEYTVEEIRASRWDDYSNGWRYLVKWEGYSENDKTWEPAENLAHCQELVDRFEAQKKAREQKKQAQAQPKPKPSPTKKTSLKKPIAPSPSSSEESSGDEGVGMDALEARREQAQKKKRQSSDAGLSHAGDVEGAVAKKWEDKAKKSAKKAVKESTAAGKKKAAPPSKTTFKKPSSKNRDEEPSSKCKVLPPNAKRPRENDGPKAASAKKAKKAPRVPTSDEDSEEDAPKSRKSTSSGPSAPRASTSGTTAPTSKAPSSPQPTYAPKPAVPLKVAPPPPDEPAPPSKPAPPPARAAALARAAANAETRAASVAPAPAPPVAKAVPNSSSSRPAPASSHSAPAVATTSARNSPAPFPAAPSPHDHQASPAPHSASAATPAATRDVLKGLSIKKRAPSPGRTNGVRFFDDEADSAGSPAAPPAPPAASTAIPQYAAAPAPGPPPPAAPHPCAEAAPQPSAEELAAKAKRAKDQISGHEDRLRRTTWCQTNPIFDKPIALPIACAEALHIDPHMIMRMKNRGVAVLFDMGASEVAKGEGHALGYCLLAVGAETPNEMNKVQAVCLHRTYSFENIEGLYCQLTNLTTHVVEFFLFGNDLPLEPILTSGYIVIVLRSAIQQSAALERFCYNIRVHYTPMFEIWNSMLGLLNQNAVPVVERKELNLQSPFSSIETSTLLSPGQVYPPLPVVNDENELEEVMNYLSFTRGQNPRKYRRYVVVTGETTTTSLEKTNARGVELVTWAGLSEMLQENYFG
ncbi:hypothetical protein JCM10213v2_004393 [Rhodosporidiobolus nylandii]